MENSRRNILILVGSLVVVCLCVIAIGVGAVGYFFPLERITSLLSTDQPVVLEPVEVTSAPTIVAFETNPPPTPEVTSPSTEIAELSPTDAPTEAPTIAPIPPEIASQMNEIEAQVIALRRLQPRGEVSRRLLSRSELRQKIELDFFEDYSQDEAQDDSIVLTALGLQEPNFDMFTFYQDLLSEQIAGQYDQKTKEMDVVQDTGFGGTERLTYAHEYTHALQDQNYDIQDGLNYSNEACETDSERCAAVQALLEGDASLLELDWFNNYATTQDYTDIQNFYQNYESPVYDSAPEFLKEDFLFPYIYGQAFVEYLYNIGGWDAIDNAYRDLPMSTEQILHPERYPNDQPLEIEGPDLVNLLGEDWREIDNGVMGEWYTYLILARGQKPEARLDDREAQIASEGWGGDFYSVLQNEQDGSIILVMHTKWESENDARQFYEAFQKHTIARFGAPTNGDGNRSSWVHGDGFTEISIQDEFTTWILSPEESTALLIRSALIQ
jgi:hypothetical protein